MWRSLKGNPDVSAATNNRSTHRAVFNRPASAHNGMQWYRLKHNLVSRAPNRNQAHTEQTIVDHKVDLNDSWSTDTVPVVSSMTEPVPGTFEGAVRVFLTHHSTILMLAGVFSLMCWRSLFPFGVEDLLVLPLVCCWWLIQEWLVHKYLLHSNFDWLGRSIHLRHHQQPYFHISIDGIDIILPTMILSLAVFWLLAGGHAVGITATMCYYTMGILYEWTHYYVHTRVKPSTALGKAIRNNHMLHHLHNENYWLGFMLPLVDSVFGTAPKPGSVRKTDMARGANKAS